MTSSILVVLCGHQCTRAKEWSVRSHLREGLKCGMFVMYCMQCSCQMLCSAWMCVDVLSRGGI